MNVWFTVTDENGDDHDGIPFEKLDHDEMEDVLLALGEFEDRFGGIQITDKVYMHISQLTHEEFNDARA